MVDKVVAFTGKKGHGKDTAGLALMSAPEFKFRGIINFADPVKKICATAFNLNSSELNDPILKNTPLKKWPYRTPRELMQWMAQTFRDEFPDVWVNNWLERLKWQRGNVICTDLRYLNEAEAVRSLGGEIYRVYNPRLPDDEFSKHISETQMAEIKVDHTFCNDGLYEHFQFDVISYYQAYVFNKEITHVLPS